MVDTDTSIALTADVVLLSHEPGAEWQVLVIQRGWPPFQGCWALPGGYVESGETTEFAARRELAEETGLVAPAALRLVGIYDTPGRDPRGHVVTAAYVGMLSRPVDPTAGDDAAGARWMPLAEVLADPAGLAFDHHTILRDATILLAADTPPGDSLSTPDTTPVQPGDGEPYQACVVCGAEYPTARDLMAAHRRAAGDGDTAMAEPSPRWLTFCAECRHGFAFRPMGGVVRDLPGHAAVISECLRTNGFDPDEAVNRQVLTLAEEVGEFVGAYRRWSGQARRTGTFAEMADELADVVITAAVTAHELGIDLNTTLTAKLRAVYARGWHEPTESTTTTTDGA